MAIAGAYPGEGSVKALESSAARRGQGVPQVSPGCLSGVPRVSLGCLPVSPGPSPERGAARALRGRDGSARGRQRAAQAARAGRARPPRDPEKPQERPRETPDLVPSQPSDPARDPRFSPEC